MLPLSGRAGEYTSGLDGPRAALGAVCDRAGLDPRGARLLRFTNNAVFLLAKQPVVVRILGAASLRHRVGKVVDVARWMEAHDVPAVRLLPGLPQPVVAGSLHATVWRATPDTGAPPTAADLGRLLRRLHELPPPRFTLPRWAPLDDVRRRLTDTDVLSDEDRSFLIERCDGARRALDELRFPHRDRVVHGDAHLGNVIASPSGPVLCDFDSTCLGPPEADLVPLPVGLRRFGGSDATYAQFSDAYGYDVTGWHGFGVLREIRELKLVTSALPVVRGNPALGAEMFRRLDDFRRGDRNATWTRYG